ncbi:MAG: hydroxypyruvate isomerase [Halioglobus sp.]
MRLCAGLGHLFTEQSLLDRFSLAKESGFDCAELTLPYDEKPEALEAARIDSGLDVILFTAPIGDFMDGGEGNAAVPGCEQAFRDSIAMALDYAIALDARYVQFVAGRCSGQSKDSKKRAIYLETFTENLKEAVLAFAPVSTQLALEAINTQAYPDYLLNLPSHLWQVIKTLPDTEVGAIFDSVHLATMGIDLCAEIQHSGEKYCHLQLADMPQRTPPGTGSLNFPDLYQAIAQSNYRGELGFEFHPSGETRLSLKCLEEARLALSL